MREVSLKAENEILFDRRIKILLEERVSKKNEMTMKLQVKKESSR